MSFKIVSDFKPMGDQPQAIKELSEGVIQDVPHQTLLGVTGSGKTFTVANVIEKIDRPTLILSHNKTLAAQLYGEFKQFFPDNAVEYFVSYYDYYQPEAYLPVTDTFIEKDLSINSEIEKLRLSATSALLSGRRDVVVISSVSCIYGIGNPDDFNANVIEIKVGQYIGRNELLRRFVSSLYSRNEVEFNRGNFRVKGDSVEIFPAYADDAYRISFWGDEIEEISVFDPENGFTVSKQEYVKIYPANLFVTTPETTQIAIRQIQDELTEQITFLKDIGKHIEAKRLDERVNYDLEMIRELGYCSGIENYSRFFDGREPGTRPFCLIDYFPDDFLMVIDESHVTIPQIRAMYGGDRSRKEVLVEHGFRLPAAKDNRPLKFDEFEDIVNSVIYISATPADYEIEKSEGVIVEQVIRPTGLLDPVIDVRPSLNQIDNLLEEIRLRIERNERTLVTTLTKRMAEELSSYLLRLDINCAYIHSDVDTLERVDIMEKLREGVFDVLVGVNLLREGLDLPEVSLVAILDADKEGFLRSERSLTQTVGRAARNVNGIAIMYADTITKSMQKTIDATNFRREKQINFNTENGIVPTQIIKKTAKLFGNDKGEKTYAPDDFSADALIAESAEPYGDDTAKIRKQIEKLKKAMKKASKELDFVNAALYRDEMFKLEAKLKSM